MKIGDWIDAQDPVVPAGFRASLSAEGPATAAGFAAAAAEAFEKALRAAPGDRAAGARGGLRGPERAVRRDRAAACALLAGDAYLTYACLLALRDDDGATRLEGVAAAQSRQWASSRAPGRAP